MREIWILSRCHSAWACLVQDACMPGWFGTNKRPIIWGKYSAFSVSYIWLSLICLVKLRLQSHCRVGRSQSPKVPQKPASWKSHVDQKSSKKHEWPTWELSFCSQGKLGGVYYWSPLRARLNPETEVEAVLYWGCEQQLGGNMPKILSKNCYLEE